MSGSPPSDRQPVPVIATLHLGYEEAEAMLRDLLSPDLISGTAIRVARDHMVQFARRLPKQLPAKPEVRDQKFGSPDMSDFVEPLNGDQFTNLLSTIDSRIKADSVDSADMLDMAWLLTLKLEVLRLRVETDTLRPTISKPSSRAFAASEEPPEAAVIAELAECLRAAIKLLDDSKIAHPARWANILATVGKSSDFPPPLPPSKA